MRVSERTQQNVRVLLLGLLAVCQFLDAAEVQSPIATLALTGDTAPNENLAEIASIEGAVFTSKSGQKQFGIRLVGSGVNTNNDSAIFNSSFAGDSLVYREGWTAPSETASFVGSSAAILSPNSAVAFAATLSDGTRGVWGGDNPGSIDLLFRESDVAPGTTEQIGPVGILTHLNGEFFNYNLGIQQTLADGRVGIWVRGNNSFRKVAIEGELAPGTGDVFEIVGLLSGVSPKGFTCFPAMLSDLRQGIWMEKPTLTPIVITGQSLPIGPFSTAEFSSVLDVSANSWGSVVFSGTVTGNDVEEFDSKGIWTDRNGSMEMVSRTFTPASGVPGVFISKLGDASLINKSDQILYLAFLDGPNFDPTEDMALYLSNPDGSTELIAHSGMQAPGLPPGVRFKNTLGHSINSRGQVVLGAVLEGEGVDESNDIGYWVYRGAKLHHLMREGDSMEVRTGDWRTIAYLPRVWTGSNDDGQRSQFTDAGIWAFSTLFTDGSKGAFTVHVDFVVSTPLPPSLSMGILSPTHVRVSWTPPEDTTEFVIERATGIGGIWSEITELGSSATSYTDYSVFAGVSYSYRVRAKNLHAVSEPSNEILVTVPFPPPDSPAHFAAHPTSIGHVRLLWDDVEDEDGYRLQRRLKTQTSWTTFATVAPNVTSYIDNGVGGGAREYFYRMMAFKTGGGDSVPTAEVDVLVTPHRQEYTDDFDPARNSQLWSEIKGGYEINEGQGFPGSQVLWFGGPIERHAETVSVDIRTGGYLLFKLRGGNTLWDGAAYWESADAGDDVIVEYNTGDGWVELISYDLTEEKLRTWHEFVVTIPYEAKWIDTKFRWRQENFDGFSEDVWGIDDVSVHSAILPVPSTPSYVDYGTYQSTVMNVSWTQSRFATGYVVEREIVGTSNWKLAFTAVSAALLASSNAGLSFLDQNLFPGTEYNYRVKATNLSGESDYIYPVFTFSTFTQLVEWQYWNFGPFSEAPKMFEVDETGRTLTPLYAFNLSLHAPVSDHVQGVSTNGFPAMWFEKSSGKLNVEFVRRKPGLNPGLNYTVQFSSDLSGWQDVTSPTSAESIDWIWERVRYEDPSTPDSNVSRFSRVKLDVP